MAFGEKKINFNNVVSFFENELKKVEETILENSKSDINIIPTVSRYISKNGGKRIRPLLLMATSKLCGYESGIKHITYSSVVELIHVATLLHDDVVDDAKTRRGEKTVNLTWGNKLSVLIADYFFAKSFLIMSEEKDIKIINFMSQATKEIVEGETLECLNNSKLNTTEDQYLDVINRKTAVLISACCRIGAVLGNVSEQKEHALIEFGKNIGIGFQLIDDVLDYFSEEKKLGKVIGSDLKQGSITLPLIHLYKNATDKEKTKIESIIQSKQLIESDLEEVLTLMKNYNSREYTLDRAKKYANYAKANLKCFENSDFINQVLSIADFIIQREI